MTSSKQGREPKYRPGSLVRRARAANHHVRNSSVKPRPNLLAATEVGHDDVSIKVNHRDIRYISLYRDQDSHPPMTLPRRTPKAFRPSAQGCREAATLGQMDHQPIQPQRGCAIRALRPAPNPPSPPTEISNLQISNESGGTGTRIPAVKTQRS